MQLQTPGILDGASLEHSTAEQADAVDASSSKYDAEGRPTLDVPVDNSIVKRIVFLKRASDDY